MQTHRKMIIKKMNCYPHSHLLKYLSNYSSLKDLLDFALRYNYALNLMNSNFSIMDINLTKAFIQMLFKTLKVKTQNNIVFKCSALTVKWYKLVKIEKISHLRVLQLLMRK